MWMGWMTDDSSNRGYWGYVIWRIKVCSLLSKSLKGAKLIKWRFVQVIYISKTQNPNIDHG